MPRKLYHDQRRFNAGFSDNKALNRYRWAIAYFSRRVDDRYFTRGVFPPKFTEGKWLCVRNPAKKPLLRKQGTP